MVNLPNDIIKKILDYNINNSSLKLVNKEIYIYNLLNKDWNWLNKDEQILLLKNIKFKVK